MTTRDVQTFLEHLYHELQSLSSGQVASYIPELSKADPNWFGISVVTLDGRTFDVGAVHHKFTIQSISKVFVYEIGRAHV